jgi:hypothetical protein
MLEDKAERSNNLRKVIMDAGNKDVITREEVGFVVSLVEKFRLDIEKKVKQLHLLEGEIAQLKKNEQIIIDLIQHMMAAAERDFARQETTKKLKAAEELQDNTLRKEALKGAANINKK